MFRHCIPLCPCASGLPECVHGFDEGTAPPRSKQGTALLHRPGIDKTLVPVARELGGDPLEAAGVHVHDLPPLEGKGTPVPVPVPIPVPIGLPAARRFLPGTGRGRRRLQMP